MPSRSPAPSSAAGSQADAAGRRFRRPSSRAPAPEVGWTAGTELLLNADPDIKIAVWRRFDKAAPL
jgi:hypothetical protein